MSNIKTIDMLFLDNLFDMGGGLRAREPRHLPRHRGHALGGVARSSRSEFRASTLTPILGSPNPRTHCPSNTTTSALPFREGQYFPYFSRRISVDFGISLAATVRVVVRLGEKQ